MALFLVTLDFCSPCSETDEHVQYNTLPKTHGKKKMCGQIVHKQTEVKSLCQKSTNFCKAFIDKRSRWAQNPSLQFTSTYFTASPHPI